MVMVEPSKDAILGLYPRTRSKRVFIHRPLDVPCDAPIVNHPDCGCSVQYIPR